MKTSFLHMIVFLGVAFSCDQRNTELTSETFQTSEKRVQQLKQQIVAPTDFRDAQFRLFNVNGFSRSVAGVPGASSYDYKFILKIDPNDMNAWTKGLKEASGRDMKWINELIQNEEKSWFPTNQGEQYYSDERNVLLVLFRKDSLLAKRVSVL